MSEPIPRPVRYQLPAPAGSNNSKKLTFSLFNSSQFYATRREKAERRCGWKEEGKLLQKAN